MGLYMSNLIFNLTTMSFLQQAEALKTAEQIQSWNQQAISSMNIAKDMVIKIKTQRQAMTTNETFTTSDIAEVDEIIVNLINMANELING